MCDTNSEQKISDYETYTKPSWLNRNLVEILTILGGLIVINLIFLAKAYRETDAVDPTTAGQLGDFVGGYIGTIFALVSVILLYSTLKNQSHSSSIEKFENKYFELIRLHRDNVTEIGIGRDFGKKIFVILIREFRAILNIVKELSLKHSLQFEAGKEMEELFKIAYITLFFGVGPNSSRMLKSALCNYKKEFVDELEATLNKKELKNKVRSEKGFRFTPFEGHQSRLGHYYRHLYQSISYVDKQEVDIDKYEYAKTLRAQLTTHEQALLFINSLAPFGKDWWDKTLLRRYRVVQNIPKDFFDKTTEIDIESYFPTDYFEWQKT